METALSNKVFVTPPLAIMPELIRLNKTSYNLGTAVIIVGLTSCKSWANLSGLLQNQTFAPIDNGR